MLIYIYKCFYHIKHIKYMSVYIEDFLIIIGLIKKYLFEVLKLIVLLFFSCLTV